jgi:DNA-binding transcriptional LysR family regulator
VLPAAVAARFARVFDVVPLALREDWAERQVWLAVRRQAVLPPPLQRFVDTLCPALPTGAAAAIDPCADPSAEPTEDPDR